MKIEEADVDGFLSRHDTGGYTRYAAPFTVHYGSPLPGDQEPPEEEAHQKKKPRFLLAFFCVPVSPGRSRMIWAFPRNFGIWLNEIMPRWFFHMDQNALLDSDMYLLCVEERNYARAGAGSWHKAVYTPTSSDTMVLAFRSWFTKHCKSQIGWAAPVAYQQPPMTTTPTKDRLMERYWSHVAQCTSCSGALKAMKALEVALQVASVVVIGFLAVSKGTLVMSVMQKVALVSLAVSCLAASRWLAGFVQNNFYFQDYVHAYK